MNDQEREDYIAACGRRLVAAHAQGDYEAATLWLTAQAEAVKNRSAAQVALMEKQMGLAA